MELIKYDEVYCELYPPKTGWDRISIELCIKNNKALYIDISNNELWTEDKKEYMGKVKLNE